MIVFPFKTAYVNKNGQINQNSLEYNSTHFMNDYYERLLYINMKIGNPPQEIKVFLTYQECAFKIGKANKCIYEEEYLSYYNRNKSLDFNYTDLYIYHVGEFEKDSCSAKDTIYAYTDLNLENYINFKDIGFYLGSDTNEPVCGVIGFKMNLYQGFCPYINNIIRSFKSNNITNNYNWIIKYNTNDEGILVIGCNMNEIISNFDENKLFNLKSRFVGNHYPWSFNIDEIICGQNNHSIKGSDMWVEIENDFSLLLGNNMYEDYIEKEFFNEYINQNICSKDTYELGLYNYKYYVYECDKEKFGKEQLKNFPSMSFILKEIETEIYFESKDLFTETKYKYFFNIIFSIYGGSKWIFGKIFLKKYPIIFNLDQNVIQIYNDINKNIEPNQNNNISKTTIFLIVFGIFVLVCLTGFLCYLLGKNLNTIRKKKANELSDDEYDYTSKEDKNNYNYPS